MYINIANEYLLSFAVWSYIVIVRFDVVVIAHN